MRQSVRDNFVAFTSPLEGVIPWMYLDIKGLVTVAIGCLIDPVSTALELPFVRVDGEPAMRGEIADEWRRVKQSTSLAKMGARAAEHMTTLRLTDDGVQQVVLAKLDVFDGIMRQRFPNWEDVPADAQLATLALAWAVGPYFRFQGVEEGIRTSDWALAARSSHINESNNPGIVPRNRAILALYTSAQFGNDPDVLNWPDPLTATPPGAA